MPIGTSKIGVLGAGVVPGGTQTFNASGTFSVPPGVTRVNITGRGGTGNPGNAGNSGNAGNPGTGGSGGAGGKFNSSFCQCQSNGKGGYAFKSASPNGNFFLNCPGQGCISPWITPRGNVSPGAGNAGGSGNAGTAGSAGNAGNPGNPGNASTGLCKTFNGGTGGNAGVAGAAGNAGASGGGGGGGAAGPSGGTAGSGGSSGGGSGATGGTVPLNPNPAPITIFRGGGGGAGITNDGGSGVSGSLPTACWNSGNAGIQAGATGGNSACLSAPLLPPTSPLKVNIPTNAGVNTMGGSGAKHSHGGSALTLVSGDLPYPENLTGSPPCLNLARSFGPPRFCPGPLTPNLFRAGAGGGATPRYCHSITVTAYFGGGGGGGGRGGAGGAGGTSPTPSGSAGTPSTFNCVPVTPGGSYPITVGGPTGGQIVISWNPQ